MLKEPEKIVDKEGTKRTNYSDGNGNAINFEVYNKVDGETFRSVFESANYKVNFIC